MNRTHQYTLSWNELSNFLKMKPYPHGMSTSFFDHQLYEALEREWPNETTFQKISGIEHHGRVDIEKDDETFCSFLKQAPAWNYLYKNINNPTFIKTIIELIDPTFLQNNSHINKDNWEFIQYSDFKSNKTFLPGLWGKIFRRILKISRLGILFKKTMFYFNIKRTKYKLYTVFNLGQTRNGYFVRPHTDNRHKLFALLVYFDDLPNGIGNLNLLQLRDEIHPENCVRYPDAQELMAVDSIPTKKNTGVYFYNCNFAYHSVDEWSSSASKRRLFYLGIAAKGVESIWKTKKYIPKYSPSPETKSNWAKKGLLERILKPIH